MELIINHKTGVTPKLNEEVSNRVTSAIAGISANDWMEFFEFLRQQQYPQINSASDVEQLQKIQSNVKAFYLMETIFKGISLEKKMA